MVGTPSTLAAYMIRRPSGIRAASFRPHLTHQQFLMHCSLMPQAALPTDLLLQRFQAVAEETRFAILRLLNDGERCVCELQAELNAAQSRLSFHLKKLKDAGLVSDRRDGRWVYYSVVPEALEEMRAFLGEVSPGDGWKGPTQSRGACCD